MGRASGIGPPPVLMIASGPGGGSTIVIPTMRMSSDNINANATIGVIVGAFGHVYNPVTQTWDRQCSGDATADAMAPDPLGNTRVISQLFGFNGATFDRLWSVGSNADGVPVQATGQQSVAAQLFGYNGSTWDRIRVADINFTVIATAAGVTPVWTPASGKKFRLMGYTIDVAGTLAATGIQTILLQDAATTFKSHLAGVIQTTTVSISGESAHVGADLGQGYLSTAANNALNINLSEAMVTGGVAINVWGTEE